MKTKKIMFFLVLCLILSLSAAAFAAQLADVDGHWAKSQVEKWVSAGLANGYPDNTFKPDQKISRAEFVALINRVFGYSEKAQLNFKDVKAEDWFAAEAAKALAAGYASGYSDGTFKPAQEISRQEAAVMLTRLLSLNSADQEEACEFTDAAVIPQWSKGSIAAVVEKGYMGGYPDGTFKPAQPITRAESIAVLDRCVGTLIQQDGAFGQVEGKETINGNVTIAAAGVTMQNIVVTGDLILAAGISDGNVRLNNVTVQGTTYINGGGVNSIILNNVSLGDIIIYRVGGSVRVVAAGDSAIGTVFIKSGAILQEEDLSGAGFKDVEVAVLKAGETFELIGDYEEVFVNTEVQLDITGDSSVDSLTVGPEAGGAKINVVAGALVDTLTLKAPTTVAGKGTIGNLKVTETAAGSTVEQDVKSVDVTGDATVIVNGKEISGEAETLGSGSGSAAGPGSSSYISAVWIETGNTGSHEGKVYQEYKLSSGGADISLSSENIESITVREPGTAEVKPLTLDADSTLWFNVQKLAGDYNYYVTTKEDKKYQGTINWAGTEEVTAEATGNSGEHAGQYYVEFKLGDLDLSAFEKMYQLKPDGSIAELIANLDTNLWFKTTGQTEGNHNFLVKQGGVWYTTTIAYPLPTETLSVEATCNTGPHEGKVYQEYEFKLDGEAIDLSIDNVASITVMEPDAAAAKVLTPDTDSTLWFNVQKPVGTYTYTVWDMNGLKYEAALDWAGAVEVTAEETGSAGEHAGQYYVEFALGTLDLSSFEKMYQVKPDGSIAELIANADTNLWFKTTGQIEGNHIFLVKQGGAWYTATIAYPLPTETLSVEATSNTGPHDEKVYQEYIFKLEGQAFDLSIDNVASITVMEPDAAEEKVLTPDTDSTLWFNVQKPAGTYTYTIWDKNGLKYAANLDWAGADEVTAQATGSAGAHEGQYYVEFALGSLNLSSFEKMYQIKLNDESIEELTANTDTNLWFRTTGQIEGDHVFLVKQGGAWYTATITYPLPAETLIVEATNNAGAHAGKVYQEYMFKLDGQIFDLSINNTASIKVIEPGTTEQKELTPDTDSTLWFNVQKPSGIYTYTVRDKDGLEYVGILDWSGAEEVTAEATGREREHEGQYYVEYMLGDLDLSAFDRMYQIKPDWNVTELTANEDTTLWFKTTDQVGGDHFFLVKDNAGNWYIAIINYISPVDSVNYAAVCDSYFIDGDRWVDIDVKGCISSYELFGSFVPEVGCIYNHSIIDNKFVVSADDLIFNPADQSAVVGAYKPVTDVNVSEGALEVDGEWYYIDENTIIYDFRDLDEPEYVGLGEIYEYDNVIVTLSDYGAAENIVSTIWIIDAEVYTY